MTELSLWRLFLMTTTLLVISRPNECASAEMKGFILQSEKPSERGLMDQVQ